MSVFLVGGAAEPGHGTGLLAPFVAEAAQRAGDRPPRLALLFAGGADRRERFLPQYLAAFGAVAEVDAVELLAGQPLGEATVASVATAHGIVVCGGATPEYHAALTGADGVGKVIAAAVATGTPYAGFSAGAMVAGDVALLGGYLAAGREVCEDGCSEGLDDLTVRPGLGLVPFTCDVHITAAGTLGRAVELVAAGLVEAAVGLDEDTSLTVARGARPDAGTVAGSGSAWFLRAGEPGEAVVRRVPGS